MHMVSSMKQIFTKQQNKFPEQIQLRFLKRIERLLGNGYPLLEALEVIAWDKELTKIADHFITALKAGKRFDYILEELEFHDIIRSFLYFTRANSNLAETIGKCAEMFEQHLQNTRKFKQILRYPLILLFIFSLVLFFINQQVLPSFHSLLQSSTHAQQTIFWLILIMDILQYVFIIGVLSLFISVLFWKVWKKHIKIDKQLKFYNSIPIYRSFLRLQTSFQFAAHFSSLLKADLSLKEILQELATQQKLPIISFYAQLLIQDLNRGFHINTLLTELPFIEKQLSGIFQKNADASALEKDLAMYSEMTLEEIQRIIVQAITLTQPIFYVILAVFIVFIYASLMWPMFQLINTF